MDVKSDLVRTAALQTSYTVCSRVCVPISNLWYKCLLPINLRESRQTGLSRIWTCSADGLVLMDHFQALFFCENRFGKQPLKKRELMSGVSVSPSNLSLTLGKVSRKGSAMMVSSSLKMFWKYSAGQWNWRFGSCLNEDSIDSQDNKVYFHPELFRYKSLQQYHSISSVLNSILLLLLYGFRSTYSKMLASVVHVRTKANKLINWWNN